MPTYDYECRSCDHSFEAFQSMADRVLVNCPECKEDGLKRLIGGGLGVIFKGSGFYVNDSRNKDNSAKPTESTSSPPPTSSEVKPSTPVGSSTPSPGKGKVSA